MSIWFWIPVYWMILGASAWLWIMWDSGFKFWFLGSSWGDVKPDADDLFMVLPFLVVGPFGWLYVRDHYR